MKNQVVTVDSSMTVMDTAKIMEDAGIGCVVVIENNIAIGIVTERDFVKRVVSRGIPLSTSIKKVMSSPLIVVNPDENIWEVAETYETEEDSQGSSGSSKSSSWNCNCNGFD